MQLTVLLALVAGARATSYCGVPCPLGYTRAEPDDSGRCACALSAGHEITPFGVFPSECVRRVANGSHVRTRPADGVVEARAPDGRVATYAPKARCLEHYNRTRLALGRDAQRAAQARERAAAGVADGWNTYVGYYTDASDAGRRADRFEGAYAVPRDPPAGAAGQTLFYFLGVQNNHDSAGLTILQPVLTWENGHAGWNMASWNCCPAGEPTTSDFLLGLEAGGVARGYYEVDEDKRTATVVSAYGGDSVSLTVERETRAFDWLNVALEVYGVDGCDELAGSAMTIDALAAVDETGASIEPEWDETVARACGGRLSAAADSWTVDHLLR